MFYISVDMRDVIRPGSRCFSYFFKSFFSHQHMSNNSTVSLSSLQTSDTDSSSDHGERLKNVSSFIPKLTPSRLKGECGRVGIIGGCFEYTGAPYFAAISSLKLGADLVYVFCSSEAGPVIKSYSPELIVHPFLDSSNVVSRIEPWLERLHVLLIGPGLGRDSDILKNVTNIISHCKYKIHPPLPLVIDADGLFLITEDIKLLQGYPGPLILTPNSVEFTRLSIKMSETDPLKIAASFNAVLLQKGFVDFIANGIHHQVFKMEPYELFLRCDVPGSNRRCGGQGDILSGCISTFVAWLQLHLKLNFDFDFDFNNTGKKDKDWFRETFLKYSMAVYGACVITRTCSRFAFESYGRGMTASDMIFFINQAFRLNFGQ